MPSVDGSVLPGEGDNDGFIVWCERRSLGDDRPAQAGGPSDVHDVELRASTISRWRIAVAIRRCQKTEPVLVVEQLMTTQPSLAKWFNADSK